MQRDEVDGAKVIIGRINTLVMSHALLAHSKCFVWTNPLNPPSNPYKVGFYHLTFTDEGTDAQKG